MLFPDMIDVRHKVIPYVLDACSSLGVNWDKISARFRREAILSQVGRMFKEDLVGLGKANSPLDIVFVPYLGCFLGNNIVQITLGKILQARGHNVKYLVCDIELPICETTDINSHNNRSEICAYQARHMRAFFQKAGFQVINLTELVSIERIEGLKQQLNDDTWDVFVESKLIRYFKVGLLDRSHPMFGELFDRARHAALISAEMGKALAALRPDRVIMSHGTYTTRGPARITLNEAGIKVLTISRAKMAESQKFNWKTAGDWWDVEKEWKSVCEVPLNHQQEALIDDYLQSRRNHKRDIVVFNKTAEEDRAKTFAKLGLDNSKRTYTLFTNVLWDAASAQREIAFKNPVEWTIETVKWFRHRPDKQLVVRTHPAETIIGTNQPLADLIKNKLDDNIPENVVILDPDAPINSWSLLKITDLGLVHTSTVGIELALEGIPCVCVSKTHYREKGFTLDINSRQEYFDLLELDEISDFDAATAKMVAKRYSYLLFLRYQLPMPFYHPRSHIGIYSFKSTDWKEILSSHAIPTIVKGIEEGDEFILPDEVVYEIYRHHLNKKVDHGPDAERAITTTL
ncbi:hypothetical protein [Lewinella sp. JB7]|uniref:capsular polysaccharide export protein, LipB/KpsS family n=1 Tax=Lewinella sp. JB7 TaxID=2962887 RepID=UPI0020C9712A|nr:hypothetical protein [Lewinella sp. JB7]MCP9236780.1 hypothetical protein [Lewinella sp. JB7]